MCSYFGAIAVCGRRVDLLRTYSVSCSCVTRIQVLRRVARLCLKQCSSNLSEQQLSRSHEATRHVEKALGASSESPRRRGCHGDINLGRGRETTRLRARSCPLNLSIFRSTSDPHIRSHGLKASKGYSLKSGGADSVLEHIDRHHPVQASVMRPTPSERMPPLLVAVDHAGLRRACLRSRLSSRATPVFTCE